MQHVPKSGDVAGWTLFRNDLVGVTTERQPRYERAPPFGWPTWCDRVPSCLAIENIGNAVNRVLRVASCVPHEKNRRRPGPPSGRWERRL